MIVLNKASTNIIIFTLTEKSEIPVPFYLFSFTNSSSDTQVLFNMADSSGYPRRFNEMTLIEADTALDPSNGRVEIEYGWGKYEVYEATSQTLDIAQTTGRIIEEGKYFVRGYPAEFNNNSGDDLYL